MKDPTPWRYSHLSCPSFQQAEKASESLSLQWFCQTIGPQLQTRAGHRPWLSKILYHLPQLGWPKSQVSCSPGTCVCCELAHDRYAVPLHVLLHSPIPKDFQKSSPWLAALIRLNCTPRALLLLYFGWSRVAWLTPTWEGYGSSWSLNRAIYPSWGGPKLASTITSNVSIGPPLL